MPTINSLGVEWTGGYMGRVVVHLHGKPSEKSMAKLIEDYSNRLKSKVRLEISKSKMTQQEYFETLPNGTILLDESGESLSSIEFADRFNSWILSSEDTHLAIGPADGFPKGNNHLSISLSMFTMPHELAAVVLMEQLYRANEIQRGSAYHRV